MRKPPDAALVKAIREEIDHFPHQREEKLIFFDNENRIRAVVYPDGFESGEHHEARQRLMKFGELKAILHINAYRFGGVHGARSSVVEYIPDGRLYQLTFQPAWAEWRKPDQDQIIKNSQAIWEEGDK